ncbi:MAG: hypothetical protein LBR27_05165 [Bifidobacteriaceae bacterium]|nr:hypothetical protein [Bifidobacteriaceae bacterium]
MNDLILALDQGTTNTKALAVDAAGRVVAQAAVPMAVTTPAPGQVEQDPLRLAGSVLEAAAACLAQVDRARVAGVALSVQRETVVAWDGATGRPLGPALSWQDTRTAPDVARLAAALPPGYVTATTGLPLDPMFSAPKAAWLLRQAGATAGTSGNTPATPKIGTVDAWLVWALTGGAAHVTEAGNAARTLLLDLGRLAWDPTLVDAFGLPAAALPAIVPSDRPGLTLTEGALAGLPLLSIMADSHAALYCHARDGVKVTYGTGSSVMARLPGATPPTPPAGIAATLAWLAGATATTGTPTPAYALEGNIRYSGACLDWTARLLGLAGGRALGDLAATVPDADGVTLVPAFGGLGAPHWLAGTAGVITGLQAAHGPAHLARAAFDAVAHQVADVLEAMFAGHPHDLPAISADGGASASALLMGRQAGLLGVPVAAAAVAEASALGTARLAADTLGWPAWPMDPTVYQPSLDPATREAARDAWRRAIGLARQTTTQGEPQ